ncbi:hypothetical protein AN641_00565 [Candidatus Epulonipiscioides gigas]|nr:hypothetical protein AN641_00565 [Epulopiscium sp. SCG-C07WGA-EpuloA2]
MNNKLVFQPYKIFNTNSQTYLFDSSSASLYKIDNIALSLLKSEGQDLDKVYEKLGNEIDECVLKDTINKMKSCRFIIDNEDEIVANDNIVLTIKCITLILVQACNLACGYCYAQEGEYADKGIMSKEVALNAIDYLLENSGDRQDLYITFFGGEPLLCFELIKEIVAYCKSKEKTSGKNFKYNMTTNGTLLTNEISQFIIKNKISTMISIDGDIEQHDSKRYYKNGNGCYNEIIEKTTYLREQKYLSARATISDSNLELKKIFEHLAVLDFKSIPMAPAYNLLTDNEHKLYVKELNNLCNYFENLLKSDITKAKKLRILWKVITNIHNGSIRYTACGAGINGIAIDINGNFYPCHRFVSNKEYIIGNLYQAQNSIEEFANNVHIDNIQSCRKCYLRLICAGSCSHENYTATGSIHNVYKRQCIETKVIYNNIIMIYLRLTDSEKTEIFNQIK